jgi:hypothetical protein
MVKELPSKLKYSTLKLLSLGYRFKEEARYLLVAVCVTLGNIRSVEPIKIDETQPCTMKVTCTDVHDISDRLKNF